MNSFKNHHYPLLVCLTLLGALLAVLIKYDGILTVHLTPLSLRIEVNGSTSSAWCLVDPQIAERSEILQVDDEFIDLQV
ncbi:MAG: hypothetical protein MET45_14440 [Nostoc sp. LLA-1]|nr:hypothetical protein [Cyanocohniella sp. LLY]